VNCVVYAKKKIMIQNNEMDEMMDSSNGKEGRSQHETIQNDQTCWFDGQERK
jgi:hypothetical protein